MKHAVITGAAHGIGKALAHRFAQAGYAITGVDIDAAGAAIVERELDARFVIADLRSEADIARVLPELLQKPIDVLIHNAGINAVGRFSEISIETQEQLIAVNLYAPMRLTAALLKTDLIAKGASIVFISSLSHYTSYPGAATYAATKSGLASYARSLSIALAPQNIHIMTVFPGPTRTAHARRHSPHNTREEKRMPPEKLAHHIFRGTKKKKHLIIPGATNRMLALLGKYCPPLMAYAMRKVILEKL
ncbi:MAG: SDR family NAD(P)-dependent oxidoreductase [Gemmatimonadota bacterium]|nr:SDR family NAD(P)-dependent oxidoreductase [Gemmatimonadota bacterium]